MHYSKTQNHNFELKTNSDKLISVHGGYRNLIAYKNAVIVYDLTNKFCQQNIKDYKLKSQILGAARSGKQNIAEGSVASGTSKKIELKLVSIARASLEELLQDMEDFLRQRDLELWSKTNDQVKGIRELAYQQDRSYKTYASYFKKQEDFANCIICVVHQTNYLLDKLLNSLEKEFLEKGGFSERMYRSRIRTFYS